MMVGEVDELDLTTEARLASTAARHGLRMLCVYGSTATGRASAESDLDLAAWYGDPLRAIAAESDLIAEVLRELPPAAPPLDMTVLDLAEPLLTFMVAADGRPIFEDCPGAFVEFSVRASAAYRDSEKYRLRLREFLRDYAAAADRRGGACR